MTVGSDTEAIEMFSRALELAPDSPEARNNLSLVRERNNRRSEAITQYRKVVKRDPGFAQPHHNLGVALSGKGGWMRRWFT